MNIDEVKDFEDFFSYCFYLVYKIAEIDIKNETVDNKQKISIVNFPRRIRNAIVSDETLPRIQSYFKSINLEIRFKNDDSIVTFETTFSTKKDFTIS